ncbi:MAG: PIG-L deacetylase family protein [Candidatus Ranarchaeia archaeon]
MKILAIVSHPDDETFGCGGVLALHSKLGYSTYILSLTGKSPRDQELRNAGKILGVEDVFILDRSDFSIDITILEEVIEIIQKTKPDIVITMNDSDYHRDHKITSTITREAIEWAGHVTKYPDKAWRVKKLYHLEGHNLFPQPSLLVDITPVIEKKKKAISVYTSQLSKFDSDFYSKYAILRAKMRGSQGEVDYAEALLEEPIPHNGPFYRDNVVIDLFKNK